MRSSRSRSGALAEQLGEAFGAQAGFALARFSRQCRSFHAPASLPSAGRAAGKAPSAARADGLGFSAGFLMGHALSFREVGRFFGKTWFIEN
jgi:hypothetical protein